MSNPTKRISEIWNMVINLGVDPASDLDDSIRIRLVNRMSVITALMVLTIATVGLSQNWPPEGYFALYFSLLVVFLPLVLNSIGNTTEASLSYLLISYIIIFCLPYIFGLHSHFQYYLIGGIGMPLIFMSPKSGKVRYILSLLSILIYLLVVLSAKDFKPMISLEQEILTHLALINDILVFLTVFTVVAFLGIENTKSLNRIQLKNIQLIKNKENIENFAYILAHDIQAPIANSVGIHLLLKTVIEDKEEAVDLVNKLEDNAQNTLKKISSILKHSTSAFQKQDLQTFDVLHLIQDLSNRHLSKIDIIVNADSSLSKLYGQPILLDQVLSNLIENGSKYNTSEHKTIEISITQPNVEFLSFEVKDNGIGISVADQSNIFKPFYRNSQVNREGTGIGLTISKNIVNGLGGEMHILQSSSNGTTFRFTWPLNMKGEDY
jgi:signal transduction histidine kinase